MRHDTNAKGSTMKTRCRAKIDRVVVTTWVNLHSALSRLSHFRTVSDHSIVYHENPFAAYSRTRQMSDDASGIRLFANHKPMRRGLPSVRVAIVPDDRMGLDRSQLQSIIDALEPCEIRIVEMALDFANPTSVDADFIRRSCKFGKSRLRPNKNFPHAAWLGAPKSHAFLRAYPKPEIDGFRVEIQFNREALAQGGVLTPNDFPKLVAVISQKLGFFEFDWNALTRFARKHLRHCDRILRLAGQRRTNLSDLLRFLRSMTIANPGRFLTSLSINEDVKSALRRWNRGWTKMAKESGV